MPDQEIIPFELLCSCYNVEIGFLETLESHGLLSVSHLENQRFIYSEELVHLEKFTRLYYEMQINVPGIEALQNMLERIKQLQQEKESLKARLGIYE